MADNSPYTTNERYNGDAYLPLYGFFIALKQNGFSTSPKQIIDAHKVIEHYAGRVQNEEELCNYLSPLFSNSEDEQIQFKEIFNKYFKGRHVANKDEIPNYKKHLKKHWWKYLVALIISLGGYYLIFRKPVLIPRPKIILQTNASNFILSKITIAIGEQIEIFPAAISKGQDEAKIELQSTYNWGDNKAIDTTGKHTYTRKGLYNLMVISKLFYYGYYQYTDTTACMVEVCSDKIEIEKSFISDSVAVGQKIKLRAVVRGKSSDTVIWSIENIRSEQMASELDTVFNEEKQYSVSAKTNEINSECPLEKTIYLTVYDPQKPKLNISLTHYPLDAMPFTIEHKKNPFFLYLFGGLSIFSLLLFHLFRNVWTQEDDKSKEIVKQKYDDVVSSFAGKKPPFELPFQNKNYLPLPEQEINEMTRQMRKRIDDDTTRLDLGKTIDKSIESMGLFQPVHVARTRQGEYLVLIDENNANSQLVKLFEYLIEVLRKHNVFIDKYYYKEEPKFCYNNVETRGISLEKLSEKYGGHILLFFGDAYQLLYRHYPVFDHAYFRLINRWAYKAVVTPVSFHDWSYKEKNALLSYIPVFPIDVAGLLLLMKTIFNADRDIIAELKENEKLFYKADHIDFEDVENLEKYCINARWANVSENEKTTNILFQWIAALATYPKIRWEITLAVGKAILDKYDKGNELNFTNLLRLARIKWMEEGRFPDYTRLDLLKKLSKENEILARETILSLLREIPESEINKTHFAYEEKEVQQVVNEFNLYAYDPVKYLVYKDSKDVFEHLWKEKKILDAPVKKYMKNPEGSWDTLISKNIGRGLSPESIPVDEYLDTGIKRKVLFLKRGTIISFVLFVGSLSMILLNENIFPSLNSIDGTRKIISFQYIVNEKGPFKKYIKNSVLTVDSVKIDLIPNQSPAQNILFPVNDSAKNISFSINGVNVFDTTMLINYDSFRVAVNDNNYVNTLVKIISTPECSGMLPQFKAFIKNVDTAIAISDSIVNISAYAGKDLCLNQISYGSGVDMNTVNNIREIFNQNKISLEPNASPAYTVRSNEIIIYYSEKKIIEPNATSQLPVAPKPLIYIQYNNRENINNARKLQRCFSDAGYNVPDVEFLSNFKRNEIRYFDPGFSDSIALLQKCLRAVYPGKTFYPVKVSLSGRARAEIWIYDTIANTKPVVNIEISSDSLIASARAFSKELTSQGFNAGSVQIGSHNYNSVITFGNNALATDAEKIKQLYNKYYPNMSIKTQYAASPAQASVNNTITVWIQKYEYPSNNPDNAGNVPSRANKRILWIDDNTKDDAQLFMSLEKLSIEVTSIANSNDAVKNLNAKKYDLVIINILEAGSTNGPLSFLQKLPAGYNIENVFLYVNPELRKRYYTELSGLKFPVFSDPDQLLTAVKNKFGGAKSF